MLNLHTVTRDVVQFCQDVGHENRNKIQPFNSHDSTLVVQDDAIGVLLYTFILIRLHSKMKIKAFLLLLLFLPGCSASARQFLHGEAMSLLGQTSRRMGRSKTKSIQSQGVYNLILGQKSTKETKISSKKVIGESAHMRRGTYARTLKNTGSSGEIEDTYKMSQEKGKTTGKGDHESEDEESYLSNQLPKATSKGLKEEKKKRKPDVSQSSKTSKSAKKSSSPSSSKYSQLRRDECTVESASYC